jgi:hypothetical protein
MSPPSPKWPSYNPGPSAEHLHAVGVVALEFSALETLIERIFWLLSHLAKIPPEFAQDHYLGLDEQKRNDALKRIAAIALRKDTAAIDIVTHLTECLTWCRDARNQILHSEYYSSILDHLDLDFVSDTVTLTKRKGKRSPDMHFMNLTVSETRAVADFIHEAKTLTEHFHMNLLLRTIPPSKKLARFREYATTLPKKLNIPPPLARTDQPDVDWSRCARRRWRCRILLHASQAKWIFVRSHRYRKQRRGR